MCLTFLFELQPLKFHAAFTGISPLINLWPLWPSGRHSARNRLKRGTEAASSKKTEVNARSLTNVGVKQCRLQIIFANRLLTDYLWNRFVLCFNQTSWRFTVTLIWSQDFPAKLQKNKTIKNMLMCPGSLHRKSLIKHFQADASFSRSFSLLQRGLQRPDQSDPDPDPDPPEPGSRLKNHRIQNSLRTENKNKLGDGVCMLTLLFFIFLLFYLCCLLF